MDILITGSSGTVGTGLCEALMEEHHAVPVDVRPNKWNERISAETLLVDLTKKEQLSRMPQNVDLVVHLAANARVYDLVVNPDLAYENILTTYNVLEYARRTDVPKIIFASSREVYGSIPGVNAVSEDMLDITRCESPYTASKMAGEALVNSYRRVYGIEAAIVRLSNVYGRYDDSTRVVPVWISNALRNAPLHVFGPEKELDFTYLDDAVDGIRRVVERFDAARGKPINLSSGSSEKLISVAQLLCELTNSRSEIVKNETRPGEVWTYRADLSRAKQLLGYEPKVDIRSGLDKAVAWYKSRIPRGSNKTTR